MVAFTGPDRLTLLFEEADHSCRAAVLIVHLTVASVGLFALKVFHQLVF